MNQPQKILPRPHAGQRNRIARTTSRIGRHLFALPADGNVLGMFKLGRTLQLVGLVIPPLAIVAQLSESISLGQMLQFLLVSVGIFTLGYLVERYSGSV